jgi:diaminopimelate decarboxylase
MTLTLRPESTSSHSIEPTSSADDNYRGLAERFGTPTYVYSLAALRERISEIREAIAPAGAELYFATMANDQLPVLRTLASSGLGACVNSIQHLELAVAAGFAPKDVQFTSTGMSVADMCLMRERQIRVNVDSLGQLESWCEVGDTSVGLRINAASLRNEPATDRIGMDARELSAALEAAARRHARVAGIHVYVGTNYQNAAAMLPTLKAFFRLASEIPTLEYVNIGGGIGVDYSHSGDVFDLSSFGRSLAKYAEAMRQGLGRPVRVIFEPGRGLVASCGTFLTAITDLKALGDVRYVGVDASVAVFPRPFHHPETPHRIRYLGAVADKARCVQNEMTMTAHVVGRTTFSRDILGRVTLPADARVGDLLAIDDAGAYSQSMSSVFLGQRRPNVIIVDGPAVTLAPP